MLVEVVTDVMGALVDEDVVVADAGKAVAAGVAPLRSHGFGGEGIAGEKNREDKMIKPLASTLCRTNEKGKRRSLERLTLQSIAVSLPATGRNHERCILGGEGHRQPKRNIIRGDQQSGASSEPERKTSGY